MAKNTKVIQAPRAAVFKILLTPETYAEWVVGCRDIRGVDDDWPAVGSRFYHRVGIAGPLTVADNTKIVDLEPDRCIVLEVRARPLGRGKSIFILETEGERTRVTLEEYPIGSLAKIRPFLDPLATARNAETLDRLAALAENRPVDEA